MSSLADDEIIEEFVAESRDHLNSIDPDLLAMEKNPGEVSPDVINRIFRAIHSIKGAAGFFGFDALKDLAHAMESVLMQVRDGKLQVTSALMDPLFVGVDMLKSMVENVHSSNDTDISVQVANLHQILESGRPAAPVEVHGSASPQSFQLDGEAAGSAFGRGLRIFRLKAFLHEDIHNLWKTPLEFLNKLLSLGELLDAGVDLGDLCGLEDAREPDLAMSFVLATAIDPAAACAQLLLPQVRMQQLAPAAEPPAPAAPMPAQTALTAAVPNPPAAKPPAAQAGANKLPSPTEAEPQEAATKKTTNPGEAGSGRRAAEGTQETLRIRVDLLTNLMNLAGELVLSRNQLMRALHGEARESSLGAILQNINQVTTSLQEGIMQTRMQPADPVFSRFPRIIRDMSKQLGKQIDLELQGSEVELDKSLVEGLTDPLTHIIRNSADHAIEMPDERRLAGKDPTGHILLRAYHQDGHVNISITDDGKGIDAARVGKKAVEKGIITPVQAQQMTERELVNLIFAPGFSTVEKVSDLSGRGVGMDVVRSNTEKMGGTVEVETVLGKGTTILLRLPLTLAIIPSMIVGVAGHRFAIPQLHVVEFVSVRAADVPRRMEQVNESEVLRLRDRLLPLVHLAGVLNIRSERGSGRGKKRPGKTTAAPTRTPANVLTIADAPLPPGHHATAADEPVDGPPAPGTIEGKAGADYHIVVLKIGLNHFGVVVDELFDIEEVVVKPTSIYARANKCFSGATIVGDGGVIMILDVGGLVTLAGLKFPDLEAESKRRMALEKQSAAVRPIILCTGAPNEYFAIPQESILRLEMFPSSSIQNVGGEEFVNYRGTGLPLLRMERYLAVSPVDPALKEIFVVIPKVIENGNVQRARAGIVISSIIDALDVDVKLDPIHVAGVAGEASVLGSAVLDGHLTLFLKIDEILKAVTSLPGLVPEQQLAHLLQPGRQPSAAMLSA